MNPRTFAEARGLFEETKRIVTKAPKEIKFVIAPTTLFLHELATQYRGSRISFASQNIFFEQSGAYTGEISGDQIKSAGGNYSIIGHEERRSRGETDEIVAKKALSSISSKLKPIICVGEKTRDKDGDFVAHIRTQVRVATEKIAPTRLGDVIIAYEPVYAIGAKHPPPSHEIHESIVLVRKALIDTHGEYGSKPIIIYGGAVFPPVKEVSEIHGLGGLLLGRASLDPEVLLGIIRSL